MSVNSITRKEGNREEKGRIIRTFANDYGVRVLNFEFFTSQRWRRGCCAEKERLLVYQKEDRSLGKIRFCCEKKLLSETQRIGKLLQKAKRSSSEIYRTSYKLIRGSVGQILLQASFGINTRTYIRDNELVKEYSLLKNINYLFASCDVKKWNSAIENFQGAPCEETVKEIIRLYSPLFRDNQTLVSKMAEELIMFLENIFKRWKGVKKRVVYGHLGAGVVINNVLINLKFTECKLSFQKIYFENLYRNYRSICQANHNEKEKIKKLAVFSPITNELVELKVEEAVAKWELEKNFNRSFTLWQLKNYINISKNNIFIADKIERGVELEIETNNPFFERLKIVQKNEE